jgi:P-type Ca2+ transporter type 2C
LATATSATSSEISRAPDSNQPTEAALGTLLGIEADAVYALLGSSAAGLSDAEAATRLLRAGPNELAASAHRPLVLDFLANLYQVFAVLLWVSAVLAFASGSPELGWAIIFVIFVNALFSFYQEYQAERAIEALRDLLPPHARVLRQDVERTILARELVPGDVMLIEEGDRISADARLVQAFDLRTIHATLTGESEPVTRTAGPSTLGALPVNAPNVVFAGTSVAHGRGTGVVFATGMHTEFGRIAGLTRNIKDEPSPLAKEIQRVAYIIAALAVGLGAALFGVGVLAGGLSSQQSMVFAIGMITANVPEGLLPTVTLALAVSVRALAKHGALVRKMAGVETLGSTSVIVTDKTGTLTQNAMVVRTVAAGGDTLEVTGEGYAPRGTLRAGELDGAMSHASEPLGLLARAAALCCNARLLSPDGTRRAWEVIGDPTEGALLAMAAKTGIDIASVAADAVRVWEIPFDSTRKRMTTVHREAGRHIAYMKGSPTAVLDLCRRALLEAETGPVELTADLSRAWLERNDVLARRALRMIAFAYRPLPPDIDVQDARAVERDMIFLGLAGMMDPPRAEVAGAIGRCRQAGIRVIMCTGDYGLTALAVATQIGLVSGPEARVVSGADVEAFDDPTLARTLEQPDVLFARVAPEHKLRIARALQRQGEVVAMTGDGVNDAPALKQADIGIAMGITGTDAAKESAQVVLADDNFATIVEAVELGRAVFQNIRKFIVYIFAHLGPEAIPFVCFALLPVPLALTALAILAIDLGTETLPALALGMEAPEPGLMNQPPRRRREPLVTRAMLGRAYLFFGLIEGALVMGAFLLVLLHGGWQWGMPLNESDPLLHLARTVAFVAIVSTQVGTAFACRTDRVSVFKIGLGSNHWLLLGVALEVVFTVGLVYVPPLQHFFAFEPMPPELWLLVLPFGPLIFAADELRKAALRHGTRRMRLDPCAT